MKNLNRVIKMQIYQKIAGMLTRPLAVLINFFYFVE